MGDKEATEECLKKASAKDPKEVFTTKPTPDGKLDVMEDLAQEDVTQKPANETAEQEPAKKLTAEDTPAQMKAEELPPKPVKPPTGSRGCCTSETDCLFYPKKALIKSGKDVLKRWLTPVWKKTCPFLYTDESGQQYACAKKDAMPDCQKTKHAKTDERCHDEHGDAILFKGGVRCLVERSLASSVSGGGSGGGMDSATCEGWAPARGENSKPEGVAWIAMRCAIQAAICASALDAESMLQSAP